MTLIEVLDKHTEQHFIDLPRKLYRNDENWVCPMDNEIRDIFKPDKNNSFEDGEACRWILKNDSGEVIGRIAAFYTKSRAEKFKQPTGGIGFFECINDHDAASRLFEMGRKWLQEKGMEAMDGPINFGENDTYWGLLVEGFTPPAFGVNYNPAYYKDLFENYGFKSFFEQTTKLIDLKVPFPERFWKIAEWVMRKPEIKVRHFKNDEAAKFAADIVKIHNEAWVHHEHFTPISEGTVFKGLEAAKQILEEDFIWFVYHNNDPVGFMVMLPDVNQILKHFNGKMNLVNKLRFLYLKKRKVITRTRITILGVAPKFQGTGIESVIFWHMQKPLLEQRPHLKEIEISWVGDFNPKMQALLVAMNAKPGKHHTTYRKLFDQTDEVQRAATIK